MLFGQVVLTCLPTSYEHYKLALLIKLLNLIRG